MYEQKGIEEIVRHAFALIYLDILLIMHDSFETFFSREKTDGQLCDTISSTIILTRYFFHPMIRLTIIFIASGITVISFDRKKR